MHPLPLIVMLLLLAAPASLMAQAAPSIAVERFWLQQGSQSLAIPYASSHPLAFADQRIDRAIVVVHGSERNATGTMQTVRNQAIAMGRVDSTLVIAPQFLIADDFAAFPWLGNDMLYWSAGWREGNLSVASTSQQPRPFRISSFAVVDALVAELLQPSRFPNLRQVVVAGHSAGGQFANRYAAGNTVEDQLLTPRGIAASYLISAPSSYLYFDNRRRVGNSTTTFAVPSTSSACPGYDNYKYGLQNLNNYMAARGAAGLRAAYERRRVTILVGSLDTATSGGGLAVDCASMLQGTQRVERAVTYWNHLHDHFGPGSLADHQFAIVAGIAHSSAGIYGSSAGRQALFAAPPLPSVLRVDASSTSTSPDGSTWARAYADLTQALQAATAPGSQVEELWVADGLYLAPLQSPGFALPAGVAIYGGFAGADSLLHPGGETARNQRDPRNNLSMLARLGGLGHVAILANGNADTLLDGFTLSKGMALGEQHQQMGGALLVLGGRLEVNQCRFANNLASRGGAVAALQGAAVHCRDCEFVDNLSLAGGGALFADEATLTLLRCRLSRNITLRIGGALELAAASAELWSCTLVGNAALAAGGAIATTAHGTPSLTVVNSLLAGNFAFGGHSSVGVGTAVDIGAGMLAVDSSTIAHNAGSGPALLLTGPQPPVAALRNSILWNPGQAEYAGGQPLFLFCGVRGGAPGLQVRSDAPQFVAPGSGDFRLAANSPYVDAGSNAMLPLDRLDLNGNGNTNEPLPLDLDGHPRVAAAPGLPLVTDLGAYER